MRATPFFTKIKKNNLVVRNFVRKFAVGNSIDN